MFKVILIVFLVAAVLYWGLSVLATLVARRVFRRRISGRDGIYLTFDDGPSPEATPAILALLKDYGAQATFFMTGKNAEQYPHLVKQVEAAGCEIGDHGYDHKHPWKTGPYGAVRERVESRRIFKRVCPASRPCLYRPPYGKFNIVSFLMVWRARQPAAFWTVDPRDYGQRFAESVAHYVTERLAPGSVVLLHDGRVRDGADASVTVNALRLILEEGRRRKLNFLTMGRLLETEIMQKSDRCSRRQASIPY